MKLQIERPYIEAMMQAFPRLEFVREQLRFGNRVEIGFGQLEDGELDLLQSLYTAGDSEQRIADRAATRDLRLFALADVGGPAAAPRRSRRRVRAAGPAVLGPEVLLVTPVGDLDGDGVDEAVVVFDETGTRRHTHSEPPQP